MNLGRPSPELIGGGTACLVGLAIVLISFLDPRDDAFPAGRPVVFVAGLVFLPLLASVALVGVLALLAWDHVLKRWIPRKAVRLSLYVTLILVSVVVARVYLALGEKPAEAPAERPDVEKHWRVSSPASGRVRSGRCPHSGPARTRGRPCPRAALGVARRARATPCLRRHPSMSYTFAIWVRQ